MASGKDITTSDLGWTVPTGKFGNLNTGLNLRLTGIATSAIKAANSLVQRNGHRAEMEIWRPATVSLMASGKDITTSDLGWTVPTGKFGNLNTGLNLTGIATSAFKVANSLVQRNGYRAEMEIWRPATVSLCAVHTSNIPLNEEAVSHLATMVQKHADANTKTLGGMVTLSSLTYLQQWLELRHGARFVALAVTMLVMYGPADAAEIILSMYRAADRKSDDLPAFGAIKTVMEVTESDAIINEMRDDYSSHMDTVTNDVGCEPANLTSGSFFVLSKAVYFLHSDNDALVTIRAQSTIPCILYTLSKLFGIVFSKFNPGSRQYISACSRYIIEASEENGTSIRIWTRLNEPIEYSDAENVQPVTHRVDLTQAIDSSFCGPQEIKESTVLAVNSNFVKVFQSMPVAWYEGLNNDVPLLLPMPDTYSSLTLSKLFASDDSFAETCSRMKSDWNLDLNHVTPSDIYPHGIDDMFSVKHFLPKSLFDRLKRSCGCSDCSRGSDDASAADCMTRSVFHWTIRRSMAMIATLFYVGEGPFRVFNRRDVDHLHLFDACRRINYVLRGTEQLEGLSIVNSHVTSRIEKGPVAPVQCLKEMALRLLTGDRNADIGLDFGNSALMRTIKGKTTYEAWIASGGLDMRRLMGYDIFPGAIHVHNVGTVTSLHPSNLKSVQKSFIGDLGTLSDFECIGRPQGITTFVTLASIQDGECVGSFKFARGNQMAIVPARHIRRLPAYIIYEKHHEVPCARAWEGEKWWDGISDAPMKGKWVSKTYGDPTAQLCAAGIAVDLATFVSAPVIIQGSGCLKCAMHHASPIHLVIT